LLKRHIFGIIVNTLKINIYLKFNYFRVAGKVEFDDIMPIRNIAIIAHVDHGKTTLTDALLKQNGAAEGDFSMDSNSIEKERGITIYAKNTSLLYKGTKVNIVDTPGHADFGSEVERVLRSIDSVLLVVDAQEGPMPQTRFVLKKSLELGLKPILVLNKIDKPAADVKRAHDEVFELFLELGANDDQLNFTTVYAIGRQGVATADESKISEMIAGNNKEAKDLNKENGLDPLLDIILEKVPAANTDSQINSETFKAQVFNLAYDKFLGRLAIARVYEGKCKTGNELFLLDGKKQEKSKITKMFSFKGVQRTEADEIGAGDIVMIAGFPTVFIGDTMTNNKDTEILPLIKIDEPTISLDFLVNNSPFAGREGKMVTGRQIRERLERELEINVGLKVVFGEDKFRVYGRGEMHISVLLENMRREGYECQVSMPEVIIKTDENGNKIEPFEEVVIDVPTAVSGVVIEKLGMRKALMKDMKEKDGQTRMIFEMPTRGLLGYRGVFMVDTKGEGILSSRMTDFKPFAGDIARHQVGSMVSNETGKTSAFSLWNLQDRGVLYVGPSVEIYVGMVVGNVSKGNDLTVNPTKGKQLTNVRSSGADEAIVLVPAWTLSIERGLEVMNEDEYLEVTPLSVRLRKIFLTESDKARFEREQKLKQNQ
jgi:GTP-binding protein